MNISIPCHMTDTHDVPITVNGFIPYWTDYRNAYTFLYENGYSFDRGSDQPLCVVLDMNYDQAVAMWGEQLQPYSKCKNKPRSVVVSYS